VIDIQHEQVIAQLKINTKREIVISNTPQSRRRRSSLTKQISSLYFDEMYHELYMGFTNGNVEHWNIGGNSKRKDFKK
jgi:hypothetical protein